MPIHDYFHIDSQQGRLSLAVGQCIDGLVDRIGLLIVKGSRFHDSCPGRVNNTLQRLLGRDSEPKFESVASSKLNSTVG